MFSCALYHWFVLATWIDDAWIVAMLPGNYIFPVLSIFNHLLPATYFPAHFILCNHWLGLVTSMDDAWIVTMLPGSYIFPALSICNHLLTATYFPVRIFDLFLLPAWIVRMLPAACLPALFFCRVFRVFFNLSPSSSDCFIENFRSFRLFLTVQFLIQFSLSYRFYSSFQPPLNLFQCI